MKTLRTLVSSRADALHGEGGGFSLVELLVVIAVLAILGSVAFLSGLSLYRSWCLKSVVCEIAAMIREGKAKALDGESYAVVFETGTGTIKLIAGKGRDDRWNTADDRLVRTIDLAQKGGGITFGYGTCGSIPGSGAAGDGISFQNNIMVCNDRLTGNGGTVYLGTPSGSYMAISANSADAGYKIYRWRSNAWVQQ